MEVYPDKGLISVQLADMPQTNQSVFDEALEAKWEEFMDVREEVFKALEIARKDKVIGNSLGAALDLYPADADTAELLAKFERLDTLFIVSQVRIQPADATPPEDAFRDKHVPSSLVKPKGRSVNGAGSLRRRSASMSMLLSMRHCARAVRTLS